MAGKTPCTYVLNKQHGIHYWPNHAAHTRTDLDTHTPTHTHTRTTYTPPRSSDKVGESWHLKTLSDAPVILVRGTCDHRSYTRQNGSCNMRVGTQRQVICTWECVNICTCVCAGLFCVAHLLCLVTRAYLVSFVSPCLHVKNAREMRETPVSGGEVRHRAAARLGWPTSLHISYYENEWEQKIDLERERKVWVFMKGRYEMQGEWCVIM